MSTDDNIPHQLILDPETDDKTWRTAMGMLLIEMSKDNKETKKDIKELVDRHGNCGIERVVKILFGNGEPEKGLVLKHLALEKEVSFKGSLWGVVGGGGMTAIIALLYVLLRNHV